MRELSAEPCVDRLRHARGRREVRRVQVQPHLAAGRKAVRHRALDERAVGNASRTGNVDRDARAIIAGNAEAADDDIALGNRVDLFAQAVDAVTVAVVAPADTRQRVAFLAALETIEVSPGEAAAKVVINSRTGTVVIGSHVRVLPAAVAHGSLAVTISENPAVSQPGAFSDGQTVVVPDTSIEVTQQGQGRMFLFEAGVSLDDIVRAVNQVGAAPGDLVAILEALRQAGALRAELVVI